MFSALCRRRSALAAFFALAGILPVVRAIVPYPTQSFFFDWKVQEQTFPGIPFPVPVTAQCDTINIVWSRSAATGPNPVPPYYLKVFTSLFLVPILIPAGSGLSYDWAVPFPPGTMYQICMYDSNGNTGGCQDTYTVIPSTTVANCANATIPPQLDVEGIVDNGPISRYGWIEECTDIQVRPKNGTPPYTFTIAPALHPPYNITGNGPSLNWTVDLSWGTPFFISVADSAGNMWSHGLLHSGGPGGKACLVANSTAKESASVPAGAAVGSGIGGLFLGLFIGLAGMFLFTRKKIKRLESEQNLVDLSGGDYHGSHRFSMFDTAAQYYPVPSGSSPMGSNPSSGRRMDSQYLIEPFTMEDGRMGNSPSPASTTNLRPNRGSTVDTSTNQRSENKIYVVHHDNNAPPVTIYHEDGTEIVELPPRYLEGRSPPQQPPLSPPGSDRVTHEGQSDVTGTSTTLTSEAQGVPAFLQQQRRPDHARKPPRDNAYMRPPQG